MVRGIPEVPEVDEPHEDADDRDDLREHISKVIQLTLQRSFFTNLRRNGLVDVADGRFLTRENNNRACAPTHDCCTLVIMYLRKRAVDWSRRKRNIH